MMAMIPKNMDLDWKLIWQKQGMYPALEKGADETGTYYS